MALNENHDEEDESCGDHDPPHETDDNSVRPVDGDAEDEDADGDFAEDGSEGVADVAIPPVLSIHCFG